MQTKRTVGDTITGPNVVAYGQRCSAMHRPPPAESRLGSSAVAAIYKQTEKNIILKTEKKNKKKRKTGAFLHIFFLVLPCTLTGMVVDACINLNNRNCMATGTHEQ